MPMRDRLARLVHRNPARLTLRERAASLKVSAAKVMHKRSPLPEPSSTEAQAAFKAACTLSDKLAHAAVHGYPELNRPDGSSWTRDSLWKALEAGEMPAAEVAHLYRLAAERELRIDAAAVRANVGALHVLAFADSWPLPKEEPHGEPVFKQIEAHRVAWAEMHRLTREQGDLIASDHRHIALQPLVDASFEVEGAAADTLLAGGADTLAGVLALARYLPGAMKQDSQDGERCQRALNLVCSSVLALADRGAIDPEIDAAVQPVDRPSSPAKVAADEIDLSGLSLLGLVHAYEHLTAATKIWEGLASKRCSHSSRNDEFANLNELGEFADFEDTRAEFLRDRVAVEALNRVPQDERERDWRLSLCVAHEMNCENRIRDKALMADVARVWG